MEDWRIRFLMSRTGYMWQFYFQSLSQYERLAQTTGDQYENVTIPTTTKIPPKIQEKTRKNSSNLPPMPVRNQAEVSYATLELNPIENPTHGMFIEWRNTTRNLFNLTLVFPNFLILSKQLTSMHTLRWYDNIFGCLNFNFQFFNL